MKFFTDIWLLFLRHLKKTMRTPVWLFIGLSQPILYLLLYMPLLKNITGSGVALSQGEIAKIFVPGMLIIMGLGSLFAGFSFIDEIRHGLIARWVVTPASRFSIILSLVASQLLTLLLQGLILLLIAMLFGLRVPVIAAVLTLLQLLLIGAAMSSLSYMISLTVKDEQALATITNVFYLPVILLSGIMLPISLAPQWIKNAARFNPFYYAVEGSRAMFEAHYSAANVWQGFLIMLVLAALMLWLAVRALRRMAA